MKEEVKQNAVVKEESVAAATRVVSEAKDDDTSKGLRALNRGNGLDLDNNSWVPPLQKITVNIPIFLVTKSRFIDCESEKNHLKVGLKNYPPINGEHYKPVKVYDSFWSLEDQNFVSVLLSKHDQMEWWKCVDKGEPEVDTQKVDTKISKISDLDPKTRSAVEKMMFDQRQKSIGLPKRDEIQKQEIMKKFMAKHPKMDFSMTKIM